MKIDIVAVGNKMPKWIQQGYKEYEKRFGGNVSINLIEIPLGHRNKKITNNSVAIEQESKQIFDKIKNDYLIIALDVRGTMLSTTQLAQKFQGWVDCSQNIAIIIGGPDGLSPQCTNKAHLVLSLGAMVFPHYLARVMLIEQLYRVFSIINSHPYHR